VFAHPGPVFGGGDVDVWGHTHEWDGTGPDAAFLQSLSRPPRGGRIFGSVRHVTSAGGGVPELHDFPVETTVHLHAPNGISTVTSKRGEFEFGGLAPGRYRVSIDMPASYISYATSAQVEIPNARACASQDFSVTDNGRIAGRVVSPQRSHTRRDGSFEFGYLPPGDYVVGLSIDGPYSRFVHSSVDAPLVITVKAGQRVDLGTLRLPGRTPTMLVSGVVTWDDGRPAPAVRLYAHDATPGGASLRQVNDVLPEADGRFTLRLPSQRRYRLTARFIYENLALVTATTLEMGTQPSAPIRIVVRRAPR
jgi:hypothetical protein